MNLYRYVNFYELYNIVKHKKMKFSKLALMDDPNEGVFKAISSQLPSHFNIGFSKSHDEILEYHNNIKNNHYISCWTTEKNSIAMWLLYSKNQDCFRISTTKEKLEKYANEFSRDNHWTKKIDSKTGTLQTFYPKCEIREVEYVNKDKILAQIRNLYKEQKYKIESLDLDFSDFKTFEEECFKIYESIRKKSNNIIKNPIFIKDEAYAFENEVRVLIDVGIRNNLSKKEFEENIKNIKEINTKDVTVRDIDYIMGTATMDFSESTFFPNILEIDIGDDFLDEVCIDPRMPTYQQNIFKEILNVDDKFVTTNIFGCIADDTDIGMNLFNN